MTNQLLLSGGESGPGGFFCSTCFTRSSISPISLRRRVSSSWTSRASLWSWSNRLGGLSGFFGTAAQPRYENRILDEQSSAWPSCAEPFRQSKTEDQESLKRSKICRQGPPQKISRRRP